MSKIRLIFCVILATSLWGCSESDKEIDQSSINSIIIRQDVPTAIEMLLVYAKSDTAQLCRILDCSPSVLKRLSNNESKATTFAQNEIFGLLNGILVDGVDVLREKDPANDFWFKKVKFFVQDNGWIIFSISVVLGFISGFLGLIPILGALGCVNILMVLLIPLSWICELFYKTSVLVDSFTTVINTNWELII